MGPNSMASAQVILKQIRQILRVAVSREEKWYIPQDTNSDLPLSTINKRGQELRGKSGHFPTQFLAPLLTHLSMYYIISFHSLFSACPPNFF